MLENKFKFVFCNATLQARLCVYQIYEEIIGKKASLPLTELEQRNYLEKVKMYIEANEESW